jgi:hypothetical protein
MAHLLKLLAPTRTTVFVSVITTIVAGYLTRKFSGLSHVWKLVWMALSS